MAAPLALLGLLACGPDAATDDGDALPSLLLVTLDTLRADHLSCYGYGRSTTPALDAYLSGGTRFRYAFSTSPRTAPSHVSLMTGLYPSFTSVMVSNARYKLTDGFVTLAELCRESGRRCVAVVSNPVLKRRLGLDQGFHVYDDAFPDEQRSRGVREKVAERTADEALRRLDELAGEPFFLWVHFQDPHGPYTPPAPHDGAFADETPADDRELAVADGHGGHGALPVYQAIGDERRLSEYVRRYDAEIRYLDEQLGRLFARLDELGLADETLVVVTADHGEAFGEHDYFCAHGHGVGPEQTRVPLAFVGPGVAAGAVLQTPVSNIDVFATAIEALGLSGADPRQSRSLAAALATGGEPEPRIGFAESVTQRAVFDGTRYLRRDSRPLSHTEFWERADPLTEERFLPLGAPHLARLDGDVVVDAAVVDDEAADLLAELDDYKHEAERARTTMRGLRRDADALTEAQEERLRALGYVK